MNTDYNADLKENAKNLRKDMTKEERHLWYDFLKKQSKTMKRQKIIGKYIVDFYCAEKKFVIELDGTQHFEDKGAEYDKNRDEYMRKKGYTVLRYSNYDINNHFEEVCLDILQHLS